MKKTKRLLSFLLAALICLSMVSVMAFADTDTAADTTADTTASTDTAASGSDSGSEEKTGGRIDPSAFTTSTSQNMPASYRKVRENKNLALYIDYSSGCFAVVNKKDGVIWSSNPFDTANDKIANSETATVSVSQLLVTFVDASFATKELNSTDARIVTESYGDSIVISFYFDSESTNFIVPLMLTLKDDYLDVELLVDSIREMSEARVLKVSVLPVFGAGNAKDEGYLLLPDGIGSLMEFNKYYSSINVYTGAVYSKDPTSSASVSTYTYGRDLTEGVRLPVYGIKRNNAAMLAVMTQSEANVTLKAYCSGMMNSYNFVYPVVNIRDSQTRRTAVGSNGAGVYYSDELPGNFKMRVYFLSGDNANYVGMAKTYRKYLVNDIGMKALASDVGTPMNVTLIGAYKRTKHFLGVPYTGVDTMTTFAQSEEILQSLKDGGVNNLVCNMIGWNKGGLEDAAGISVKTERRLGGKSGMKSLLEKADELSIPMMLDVDLTNYYKSTGSYKKYNATVYGLDLSPVPIFPFVLSLNRVDRKQTPHYLFHPTAMLNMASQFVSNASGLGLKDYSFMSIGETPYAAYNKEDVFTRDHSTEKISELYSKVAESTDGLITSSQGNAYVFPAVNNIVEAPLYNSKTYFAETEAPFYYLALRGLVRLSGPAYNLSSETEDVLLRSAQYGVGLYAVLSHESSSNLKDTSYNNYYSTEYALLGEDIQNAYKRLSPVYKAVGTSAMTGYTIVSDTLKISTFANGAAVYVNYGESDVTYRGVKIGARDFTVVGGDK